MGVLDNYENFRRNKGQCEVGSEREEEGVPCSLYHYQTTRFQVGTGASANDGGVGTELSSTVSLGQALTKAEYGNSLMSVDIVSGNLYSAETTLLDTQDFGYIRKKSPVTSSLVHIWVLDEETANGQLLDEAGLFIHNPYLHEYVLPGGLKALTPKIDLVGGTVSDERSDDKSYPKYQPGHLLAAYKKFNPIKKENYFSLLFRWSISFPTGY